MFRRLAIIFCLAATPAAAGIPEALGNHVLPGVSDFAAAAGRLSDTARKDCRAPALRPAYHEAFDAWMSISHLRFGPLETDGRALAIAFWPDPRGLVGSTLNRLIAAADPVVDDPAAFAEVSIAGRGLFALERLLFDAELSEYGPDDYRCALALAIATDLARMAADIEADWQGAADPAEAGAKALYRDEREARQVFFTALMSGLEFAADQRLGRPLGSFDRPRPARAEARRSDRARRNVVLSLEALRDLARQLSDAPIPKTEAAFADAIDTVAALGPVFAGVDAPQDRLKVEIAKQKIEVVERAAANEVGTALGVSAGFNATDGD